ncbi:MAG: hypothetical protein RBJ76_28525 [Stenomitos frigidus ULC029]
MANVYTILDNGITSPMKRIHCKSEDQELQLILENNPDLLPGDQINPDNPRRWLLIKREMPVPDPNTGADRWSLDFFFVDQDATPTFVECKLFRSTEARRQVVGQLIEYAANGHHYWTKELIRDFAVQTAAPNGLEEALQALQPTNYESPDAFFDQIQANLREGQVRLIFFLEQASMELRSIVNFLNKQMERSEILLVEARQYELENTKIVAPVLFGYTEEARKVKRNITVLPATSRRKWDKSQFFAHACEKLSKSEVQVLEKFCNQCLSLEWDISWGSTGSVKGTFGIKDSSISERVFSGVTSEGRLFFNFGWLTGEIAERARDNLKTLIVQRTDLPISDDYVKRYPSYPITIWGSQADLVFESLRDLLAEFRVASAGQEVPVGETPEQLQSSESLPVPYQAPC